MKTWTIQKKEVLKHIQSEGEYFPSFFHKDLNNKNLPKAYSFLLALVNKFYQENPIKGVVFCMAPSFDKAFKNIDEIKKFLEDPLRLKYFVNNGESLLQSDNVLLELEYSNIWSFLDVDVELFCALDECLYRDVNSDVWNLKKSDCFFGPLLDMVKTLTEAWLFDNSQEFLFSRPIYFVQQHVPYIKQDNIINCYPVSDLTI